MAVQFKTSGTILFKASGSVAMDADCCCGCTPCCDGFSDKTLYLSISDLTFDGAETCDAGCVPSITAEPSLDTGGGETACGDDSATFFVAPPDAGTAELSVIRCNGSGEWEYSSDGILVRGDGGAGICAINLVPGAQTLTGLTCDPFFWEGDLAVEVYNDGEGTPCGSGTIHVVITE